MGRIRATMTVIAMAMAVGLIGCNGDGEPEPSPDGSQVTSQPSPTGNPAEDEARTKILATYDGYLEAYIAASAKADYRTKDLAEWVAEPLLGQLLNNLQLMSNNGVRNVGRPRWSPTVTELRLEANDAVIEDCFDSTDWNAVGGRPAPTAQARKYPVVAKVKRVGERWYVYESNPRRDVAC
ncbi:hypothetical protein O7627_27455 [Solwaraspora sp. WMMD1047]|uniref:hypothetical protein n=1 Tax=Solwaraspora sp. WMMD1047 TaxID=3016102 RepID=UPI00241747B0|nr:hypothetical protein [Solwaraspora sp. WMMD1047]MDG4833014.1 hypothetical protein [Solwaraspora sp. WMMD1047]